MRLRNAKVDGRVADFFFGQESLQSYCVVVVVVA